MKSTFAKKRMYFLLGIVLFLLTDTAYGAPYKGTTHTFVQPDGTVVTVRLFGDEYYMRAETPDGFTVVRDEQTGWISYASYDENIGELKSTGIPFTNDNPTPMDIEWIVGKKHLAPSVEKIVQIANFNHKSLLPNSTAMATVKNIGGVLMAVPPNDTSFAATGKVSGEIQSLTIVVDFSDAPAALQLPKYEAYFNDLDWHEDGNSMSVRRYYREVSFGNVDLTNQVFGIFRAPKTFKEYDAMPYAQGATQIIRAVLQQLNNDGFDFSQLSTNSNGVIKALNFMYTGNPKTWAQGMWYHQGWVDFSADGVRTGKYACGSANSPLEVFTAVHENGHMIANWPDTYQYSGATEPIGNFCVMGGWGKYPPPPNAAFRTMAGWSQVVDITGKDNMWQSVANDNIIYKYRKQGSANQYFLIEARQKDNWLHYGIPDSGLTIWRVDTNGDQQNTNHLMVELIHADNDWKDKDDACFHAGGVATFNDDTTPSAKWWGGARSGLDVHDISEVGKTMTFITGEGACTDTDPNCVNWASNGECVLNPDYMLISCCAACESVQDDNCPNDPNKTTPGVCGCGQAETDSDADNSPDCVDNCPDDPNKTEPGVCGCGEAETDSDGDATLDCEDGCPDDPNKTDPGMCGCGQAETDSDADNSPDCVDNCPDDPNKTEPGVCGCSEAETDSDGDATLDCEDGCPDDPNKTDPGMCGCGQAETDSDGDGTLNCLDDCPDDLNKTEAGLCGCGQADTDSDGDGTPNCTDQCPDDPTKTDPGSDGCTTPDDSIMGFSCSMTPGTNGSGGLLLLVVLIALVCRRRMSSS